MKELFCPAPGELLFRESEKPEPSANEVRVRAIYGGICGSDINVYKGRISYAKYPVIAGHEVLGRVVAAGESASHLMNSRVVVFPNTFCGDCALCKRGLTNICAEKTPMGLSCDGVFSEEFNINKKYVIEVPENLPDERAVLIEPLSVTIHALNRAKVFKGDKVAVLGCGTEGLLSTALAVYYGAEVTSLDINSEKLEAALQLGAKDAMNPDEAPDSAFDVVIEASGARAAAEQAYNLVKAGGRVLHIGILNEATLPMLKIVRGELDVYGSMIYTMSDFQTAARYLGDPDFNIAPVLSKIVPFSEAPAAFDDAASGKFAKIVLDFSR